MYSVCAVGVGSVKIILFSLAVLKELLCDVLKERVAENVLVLLVIRRDLVAELIKLRLKKVGGTYENARLVTRDLLNKAL
jgi:hypothetical protein